MDVTGDDDRLMAILDSLTERVRLGEEISLERAIREYPEQEQELRELWGTVLFAENFANSTREAPASMIPPALPASPAGGRFASSLFDDYELVEELGRGGMGVVFRARQRSLNRWVAIKMLLLGEAASQANLQRFRSEAEAAARLDHPHIVTVYEVGSVQGLPFFTMPLIEGTTLARRIAEGPLPDREAARLMLPVCRAVAAAHAKGVLHRDLKPSNILVDESGRPFVSDFGLAKQFPLQAEHGKHSPSITETGAILGTPGYMAPEQAAGRGEVGTAADIYGLGAVLYACVTGRPPFQAANPVDALLLIREQDPPLPRLLNPGIDPDLEMIILKATQKPPDLRYASADALADDLEAYVRNEPVSARSSQFSQVLSRAFRPTHHFSVLENWGLLWMWHGLVIFLLCLFTDGLQRSGVTSRSPYVVLWTVGLGTWGLIFWNLRHRSGPVTFVERQIAHVWAASMASSTALFGIEALLGLPVLTLSPVLALLAASVFIVKAGILSGEFYLHATLLLLTSLLMAFFVHEALLIFGFVVSSVFIVSGWRFHRLRRQRSKRGAEHGA
ncbi:serine/threonine-protein kinase [Planctomicrobium sp. SH664]|uniref:serine/threonine-protein kinase n=1 Tax=Planctomicrobium sp. SH664 TaxID=3448125 RepID=UPI003F5B336F